MTGLEPWLVAVAVAVMAVGMLGVVIPILPGLFLVWVATAGTILLQATDPLGWSLAAFLTVLFLAGTAATVILPARQGMQGGAARSSFGLAALGAVIGFFVIPVLGFLLGGLAGLLVGELRARGDWDAALASTGRVVRAYGIGVLIEFVIGLSMIATWVVALLLR
jgi:uncharacterized protein